VIRINMAWIFQLAIECNTDAVACERMKGHFDRCPFVLEAGIRGRFAVDTISQDENNRWWVSVSSSIGEKILQSTDSKDLIAQVSEKLYDRLRSVSGYRFALAGVEAFQFNNIEALPKLVRNPALAGLVVDEQLFGQLGMPSEFIKFAEGYFWRPYQDYI
jgi:hypothetical protein